MEGIPVVASGFYYPCIACVPMGWSWAFWFIQGLHEQVLADSSELSAEWCLRDGAPCPCLDSGHAAGLPYCDNLNVLGTDPVRVLAQRKAAQAAFEAHGLAMHEETNAEPEAVILGADLQGKKGRLTATSRRRTRLRLALL